MKILIADDNFAERRLLAARLIKWGYEVASLGSGREALDALCAPDAPPLAILDWLMPDIDGTEVCRRLRASSAAAGIYIILLTGKSNPEDIIAGLGAGADTYLAKPVNPEELRARVQVGARVVDLQRSLRTSEEQLRQAHKMEAVGQLAAGIAHEINTPLQYVGDNIRFSRNAFDDIAKLLETYGRLLTACRAGHPPPELLAEAERQAAETDVEYLAEEVPKAIEQSLEGVGQVSRIVQSMKDFAHPGSREKVAANLNKAIESTITVASNEWKYVAEVHTDFDETLPMVFCLLGEINQVVLNMIVNAAHAIADATNGGAGGRGRRNPGEPRTRVPGGTGKGAITISTRHEADAAVIRISDTGTGIPEEILDKVFDPFFTTKEVGRGTGQGLALAYAVITERHSGSISIDTEVGHGTTFTIKLPIGDRTENAW